MSVGIIVSCTIDYMSCSENRNYSPPLIFPVVGVEQQSLVILLPCSHSALLSFWLILLFGSVLFIPQDHMKSSHDTYSAATMLFNNRKEKKFSKMSTVCFSIHRLLLLLL